MLVLEVECGPSARPSLRCALLRKVEEACSERLTPQRITGFDPSPWCKAIFGALHMEIPRLSQPSGLPATPTRTSHVILSPYIHNDLKFAHVQYF